ncbi:MAG: hypothetical protein ACRC7G_15645, partial [Beijerinckiaceae bacterium]
MLSAIGLLFASEAGSAVKRHVRAGIIAGAGLAVGIISLLFGLLALRLWLAQHMTLIEANLTIAGGLIVIALALVGWAVMVR